MDWDNGVRRDRRGHRYYVGTRRKLQRKQAEYDRANFPKVVLKIILFLLVNSLGFVPPLFLILAESYRAALVAFVVCSIGVICINKRLLR